MKRIETPQFTSAAWFPGLLTQLINEFMSFFVIRIKAAKPFLPVFEEAFARSGAKTLVNLDSGFGAGIETLEPFLENDVTIVRARMESPPPDAEGTFCSINGFHRLSTTRAREVLAELSSKRKAIVIVEGNNDNWWQAVGMLVFVPLTVILSAPFVRPFRFSRLIFTYLIPVLPLVTSLDGASALFRLFNPDDLDELTGDVNTPDYNWRSGKLDNGRGGKIIYLLGWPDQGAIRSKR